MVSPRTPNSVQKRYGPSEGRNLSTEVLRKRLELGGGGGGGDVYDFMRKSNNGRVVGEEWEEEREAEVQSDEVFLQRALAAIKTAGQRGDGVVEMEEREWQAWKLHEAMEREIEKRVAEREMEREMQRERDLARAEELQRELDMLRSRAGAGEPGFMVDQGFTPLGYSSNSSSSSSLLSKTARPYSTFTGRQQRFMPDSTDPMYAQNLRREYPLPSSQFRVNTPPAQAPAPPYLQPAQSQVPAPSYLHPVQPPAPSPPAPSAKPTTPPYALPQSPASSPVKTASAAPVNSPSRKPSSRSSSLTRERKLSEGKHTGRERSRTRKEGEEVYTSAATALKDARRRRRAV